MNKLLTAALISCSIGLVGCGVVDRGMASFTGKASEACQDGVMYLQFTSGVTVKYKPNGTLYTCGENK